MSLRSDQPRRPGWPLIVVVIIVTVAVWLAATTGLGLLLGPAAFGAGAAEPSPYAVWLPFLVGLLNLVALGGFGLALGLVTRAVPLARLGLTARPTWLWLGWVIGVTFGLLPLRIAIGVLYVAVTQDTSLDARSNLIFPELTLGAFASAFIGVGVLAPIGEEAFFRGVVYTLLRQRLSAAWSVGLSSLAFALAHADSPPVILTSLIIGLALAWVYEKTQSLWPGILIHILNNSVVVVLGFGALVLLEWLKAQGLSP